MKNKTGRKTCDKKELDFFIEVGKKIKILRLSKGFSRAKVAKKLNCSHQQYSNMKTAATEYLSII